MILKQSQRIYFQVLKLYYLIELHDTKTDDYENPPSLGLYYLIELHDTKTTVR